MKVKDLKRTLENFDDDAEVIFADYEPVVNVVETWNTDEEGKSYCVITDRDI